MYRPNFYESTCLRCKEIVYQVDRIGPLKDFTFFHSGCFKCKHCGTKLTLKTYYNNQHDQEDKEVSCYLQSKIVYISYCRKTLSIIIIIILFLYFVYHSLIHFSNKTGTCLRKTYLLKYMLSIY